MQLQCNLQTPTSRPQYKVLKNQGNQRPVPTATVLSKSNRRVEIIVGLSEIACVPSYLRCDVSVCSGNIKIYWLLSRLPPRPLFHCITVCAGYFRFTGLESKQKPMGWLKLLLNVKRVTNISAPAKRMCTVSGDHLPLPQALPQPPS